MSEAITRLTDYLAVYNAGGSIDDRDLDKENNSQLAAINKRLKTVIALATTLAKGDSVVYVDPVSDIPPIVQIGDENGDAIDILRDVKADIVTLSGAISLISGVVPIPIGGFLLHNGTTPPENFFVEDGSSLVRLEYPEVFAVIGTSHGTADSLHFNLPYSLGLGFRGVDNGEGNDPNAATRTASNPGGATGDNVGTYQADQFKAHTHKHPQVALAAGSGGERIVGEGQAKTEATSSTGGSQTNMRNVTKLPCIRYQ